MLILELKRRAGDETGARAQDLMNHKLRNVVKRIEMRKVGGTGPGMGTPSK